MRETHFKAKLTAALVALALIFTLLPSQPAFADEAAETEAVKQIEVTFTTSAKIEYKIDFPYSDNLFSGDDGEYSQDLAKASMGLTVAAFRVGTVTDAANYLRKAGFTDIDVSAYRTLPGIDTIAYCMAHKAVSGHEVIAVGVCGGDYGKEWASNFTIGDETRHVGFNRAAQTVIERIKTYIEKYDLEGDLRLWVTGMSRAGAVSNIVAADMTDSGLFTQVYAYCFGCPRTTRDAGNYDNIFNIMSKDDVVPKVPFADWGYERYGVDLYLPSQECDSCYMEKAVAAAHVLNNGEFRNNPELYDQFRVLFNYLYEIFPTSADYEARLQGTVIDVVDKGFNGDLIGTLKKLISGVAPQNDAKAKEMQGLLSYLDVLGAKYVLHGNTNQVNDGSWDPSQSLAANLMIEHTVTTYIPWVLSADTGEELYSDSSRFIHLSFYTPSAVYIYGEKGLIETLEKDGSISYEDESGTAVKIAAFRHDSQVLVDLPLDSAYAVAFLPEGEEETGVLATEYSTDTVKPEVIELAHVTSDPFTPCIIRSPGADYGVKIVADSTYSYTSDVQRRTLSLPLSTVTKIENLNVFNLSVSSLVRVSAAAAVLLGAELLVVMLLWLIRKLRGKEKSAAASLGIFTFNVILLLAVELEVWYLAPALKGYNCIFLFLTFVFVFFYSLKGRRPVPLIIMLSLMAADLYICYITKGPFSLQGAAGAVFRDIAFYIAALVISRPKAVKSAETGGNADN